MSEQICKLLVVDDDIPLRTAFARGLTRAGFDVSTMTGSIDVVDAIVDDPPCAVLIDNHMPDAGGVELIEMIRARFQNCDLPILLVSGSSDQDEIDHAMRAGATDFRRKPVDLGDLVATVKDLVARAAASKSMALPVVSR